MEQFMISDHILTLEQPLGDLIFCAAGGREILRMKPDGTIAFGDGLTQTDAAREFLNVLAELYPRYLRKPGDAEPGRRGQNDTPVAVNRIVMSWFPP